MCSVIVRDQRADVGSAGSCYDQSLLLHIILDRTLAEGVLPLRGTKVQGMGQGAGSTCRARGSSG